MVKLQDREAERALLGSILEDRAAYVAALDLQPSDFCDSACAHLFEAIRHLAEAHEPIEPVGLTARIAAMGGGIPPTMLYGDLLAGSALYAETYVERVASLSAARKLSRGLRVVLSAVDDGELSASDAVPALKRATDAACKGSGDVRSIHDVATDVYRTAQERKRTSRHGVGVETGIRAIDGLIKGLAPKKLVVLAARPGIGKSALALQFADKVARSGGRAILFSLEMDADEIGQRLLSQRTRVPLDDICTGRFDDAESRTMSTETGHISELRLMIDDRSRTLGKIAMRVQRESLAGPIGLVVVDYLQLVQAHVKGQPREQEVASVSRALKGMAMDHGCCVVALSQLNRALMQRADRRPLLSDLRESGAIEQDADVVMFLHRESIYGTSDDGKAEVIIAKNRGGVAGTMKPLVWSGPTVSFGDLDIRDGWQR